MATHSFTIFEDITTFDVVWKRVSDSFEVQTGSGELECDGIFTVKHASLASPPASSSTTQISSASSIPMIATFIWEHFSAEFACDYNQTSRSYGHFSLVDGSMSKDVATALRLANEFNNDVQPELCEWDEGVWKLEMYTMYHGLNSSYVELWAKKRVNGVEAKVIDSDLRDWSLGQYASVDEEEDEGEGEDQEVDSSEDESDPEGEKEEEEEEHSDA